MYNPLPYRFFPDLDDLRRVGLLFATTPEPAPQLFNLNAAASKEAPRTGRRYDQSRVGEINEVQFGLDAMRHDYICGKPETVEAFDLFVVPRDFVRLPVLSSPGAKATNTVAS